MDIIAQGIGVIVVRSWSFLKSLRTLELVTPKQLIDPGARDAELFCDFTDALLVVDDRQNN